MLFFTQLKSKLKKIFDKLNKVQFMEKVVGLYFRHIRFTQ